MSKFDFSKSFRATGEIFLSLIEVEKKLLALHEKYKDDEIVEALRSVNGMMTLSRGIEDWMYDNFPQEVDAHFEKQEEEYDANRY